MTCKGRSRSRRWPAVTASRHVARMHQVHDLPFLGESTPLRPSGYHQMRRARAVQRRDMPRVVRNLARRADLDTRQGGGAVGPGRWSGGCCGRLGPGAGRGAVARARRGWPAVDLPVVRVRSWRSSFGTWHEAGDLPVPAPHSWSPGESRRWASRARDAPSAAAYRSTICRDFQPVTRMRSDSSPPARS